MGSKHVGSHIFALHSGRPSDGVGEPPRLRACSHTKLPVPVKEGDQSFGKVEIPVSENLTSDPCATIVDEKVTLSLECCLVLYGFLGVLERIAELSKNPAYSHVILEAVEKIKRLDHP